MKRQGYLIEKIANLDNLYLAVWKAKKGKEGRTEVIKYTANLQENLRKLQTQITDAVIKVGNYRYVKIFDPKERLISVSPFSERVMQHAIMNICHDNFEKFQTPNSYASRKEKGTYAAIERAKKYQRQYSWFLKLDMRRYFDSIDHNILKRMLRRRFKDGKLLQIFDDIINSYSIEEDKGLPIGNLTSQYFANHYLAVADHYLKEGVKVNEFVRYMDDIVIWSNDKYELLKINKLYQEFCNNTLYLTTKPICLNRTSKGLPFCGYILFPNKVLLGRLSKKRFINKNNMYNEYLQNEIWNEKTYQQHIVQLLAFVLKADSYGLRTNTYKGL